jgi:hypothetical protein
MQFQVAISTYYRLNVDDPKVLAVEDNTLFHCVA